MKSRLIIYGVVVAVVINFTSAASIADSSSLSSEMKDLIQNRKSLAILKAIIEEMDSDLARLYKRSCNINLPGFDCDNSRMVASAYDTDWWSKDSTPGKRKGCINTDGSCDLKSISEQAQNFKSWLGGPGRRKRSTSGSQ